MLANSEIHLLELSKFDVPVEALQTPLERWCYFFNHGASLDPHNLPATLDVPGIRKAMEVLVKLSREEIERHWAAERVRAENDLANWRAEARAAREEGRQQGLEEGREEGRAQGRAESRAERRQEGFAKGIEKGIFLGRIRLLQQLLGQPEASNEELQRLPEQDLLQLEESLKQQLRGKKPANGTPPTDKT
jgi:flagellar biosynthesis/type III secretory pathway protein FliH